MGGAIYNPDANIATDVEQCADFNNTLFEDDKIIQQITAAGNAYDAGGLTSTACSQSVSGGKWAVAVLLKSGDGEAGSNEDVWCVDSGGANKAYSYGAGESSAADAISADVCE